MSLSVPEFDVPSATVECRAQELLQAVVLKAKPQNQAPMSDNITAKHLNEPLMFISANRPCARSLVIRRVVAANTHFRIELGSLGSRTW